MTFAEFLEKCREKDGWQLHGAGQYLRNAKGQCPLAAVFGRSGYVARAKEAGLLNAEEIMAAADNTQLYFSPECREALLTLVKP